MAKTIILPNLEKIIWKKSKNKIYQFIEEKKEIELNVIREESYYLDIKYNRIIYHITLKRDNYPKNKKYILIANKKPTVERLAKNDIKLKWFKHPKLKNYTSKNIIKSWDKCFHFIEENKEREVNGLRLPQIAMVLVKLLT